jgi:cellulose synthase (UDP-forming)
MTMSQKQTVQLTLFILIGLLAVYGFGSIWFNPQNITHTFHGYLRPVDLILYLMVTYVIWLPIFMKILFWATASHIRELPIPTPPSNARVAFITTFVPSSESIQLLHQTLPAMVRTRYLHDTWVLDEGDSPEVRALCERYGVKHFSRFNKPHYNSFSGKFAQKTKGGNHNSWYDVIGNSYDFVAQIDTDFVPMESFLEKTLGYFKDPRVAFVGTPQIYGNTKESLIARGAAEQTYNFYGPLLRGMNGMGTTILIGANHVIRVAALEDVNHYSAHITEDLLTGMKLHSHGWTSVYVPEALAIGEGPVTWKAYFDQQKRWAYGCMHILFNHSFRLFSSMTPRRIVYYFCIQQHYFSGLAMLLGIFSLSLYFFFGVQSIRLDLVTFLMTYGGLLTTINVIDIWLQHFNVRPREEKGVLWAGMYISVAVRPIFLVAFLNLFKRKRLAYKVTPKGRGTSKTQTSIGVFVPHIILGLISLIGFVSSFYTHRNAPLMLFWAIFGGCTLLLVPVIPVVLRVLNNSHIFKDKFPI